VDGRLAADLQVRALHDEDPGTAADRHPALAADRQRGIAHQVQRGGRPGDMALADQQPASARHLDARPAFQPQPRPAQDDDSPAEAQAEAE
jgi:hypothetical protein